MASLLDEGTPTTDGTLVKMNRYVYTGRRNRYIRDQSLGADIIRHRRRDKYA